MEFAAFDRMSKSQKRKIALGVGGAVALGAIIVAARPKKKKKKKVDYGLKTNKLCNEWSVTDPDKLRRTYNDIFDAQIAKGQIDPWMITNAFLARVAPQCRRPLLGSKAKNKPQPHLRNPGEAILYYNAFVDTVTSMEQEGVITAQSGDAYRLEGQAWAVREGVPSEQFENGNGMQGDSGELHCEGEMVPVQMEDGTWTCDCPPGTTPTVGPDNALRCV